MTSPPPTGFAGPLKVALPVARRSRFHCSRADMHYPAAVGFHKEHP